MKQVTALSVLMSLMAVLLLAGASLAAGPEPNWANVDKDLEGPDYLQPPQHYRTLRMILAEAGLGPAPLGPPPQPVTGTREILVILIELSNIPTLPAYDVAYFTDRFFDTSPPSVRHFYTEVSYGEFTYVPGAVLGWYASSYSSWHWLNDSEPDSADHRDVMYEAILLADADFDFSVYDTDNNGTVTNDELTLFFIVTGAGGAFHGHLDSFYEGTGAGPGSPTCDGKIIEGEFNATNDERHIGSYVHELGHDLGLPDLYDTDGFSNGIGEFGMMGGGSWTFSHPTAWCKIQLGWITPIVITSSGYYNIDDSETHAEAFILRDSDHSMTEYFLIENKRPANSYYETIGPPVAPDGTYPDSGLIIYHIDEAMVQDWITLGINNVNTDEAHKGVDVETAEHPTSHVEDADDLDDRTNRGDEDDLWDCGEYDFDDTSSPCASVWYGGGSNDISVRIIPCVGDVMMTYLTVSNSPPVASCKAYQANADENCEIAVGVADIDDGSYDPDGAPDIAEICITHVDGSPVGCLQSTQVSGMGGHSVTLRITDLHGLDDACDAPVTVLNTAPTAACKSYVADADENCCITVSASDVDNGSSDPEGNLASLAITAIDGSPVAPAEQVQVCTEGDHTVTLTATDGCGLSHSCVAPITVIDVTPPEISVLLNRYALWPPNHKMADIIATILVEDNCDPNPEVVLASIMSSESPDSLGDGSSDPDIDAEIGTDDRTFKLRSERSGVGDGRIYTIIYTATDFSNNSASETVSVNVAHDQGGVAMASLGFNRSGTGLNRASEQFVLVIPSREGVYGIDEAGNSVLLEEGFDATQVDIARAYVGNTVGVILPEKTLELDNNGDRLADLALFYSTHGAEPLVESFMPTANGEVWVGVPLDPLGFHYKSSSGVNYLVADIFQLGPPVPLAGGGNASVTDGLFEEVPEATALLPVSPNPFGRATTVRYSLRSEELVELSVFDVRGVLVRTLADGLVPAGIHQRVWNGSDAGGREVAAGIYFVRFRAGQYRATEKVLLLK